jgi:hypothetical protein
MNTPMLQPATSYSTKILHYLYPLEFCKFIEEGIRSYILRRMPLSKQSDKNKKVSLCIFPFNLYTIITHLHWDISKNETFYKNAPYLNKVSVLAPLSSKWLLRTDCMEMMRSIYTAWRYIGTYGLARLAEGRGPRPIQEPSLGSWGKGARVQGRRAQAGLGRPIHACSKLSLRPWRYEVRSRAGGMKGSNNDVTISWWRRYPVIGFQMSSLCGKWRYHFVTNDGIIIWQMTSSFM